MCGDRDAKGDRGRPVGPRLLVPAAARRLEAFARLRERESPAFFPELKLPFIKTGPGYYALARHADVVEASRTPEIFSSEPCSNSIADLPRYMARYFGSMINMDDPRHAKIRRIVSRAFTPASSPSWTPTWRRRRRGSSTTCGAKAPPTS